ncbi:MAG: peptidase C14 caspase catalytic subunit p20, partial [Saprospiraceae bacterium]|nr:peptidase C14 caspase catalytic subunit p20 [Saprospiraceae bacterium]
GRGSYQFDNGNKYVGDFRESLMNGKGTLYFSTGNRYNGDWVKGLREGIGIYYFTNGNTYTGSFRKNKFSGQGTMTFTSGNKYVGLWENDQPNGRGVYSFTDGSRYEGSMKNGKFEGFGNMTYKNGEQYVGDWANNERHGRGKLIRTGKVIEGTWVNGKMQGNTEGGSTVSTSNTSSTMPTSNSTNNDKLQDCNANYCREGKGVYKYGDGSRWVGEFKDGTPEGQGTCFYTNGDKYIGEFERHAPHGEGAMHYKNGRVLAAIWEYGRPVGELPSNSSGVSGSSTASVDIDRDAEVKIWAVVVGVGRYSTMPVLKYSDDDAYQFFAFLKSPEGGALPDKQCRVLVDEDATRANILSTMRQVLLKADENDVVVFYFSGHGLEGSFCHKITMATTANFTTTK